jgi:hypothetical protein
LECSAQAPSPVLPGQGGETNPWLVISLFALGVLVTALSFSSNAAVWDLWGPGSKFEVQGGMPLTVLGLLAFAGAIRLLPGQGSGRSQTSSAKARALWTRLAAAGLWLR